MKRTLFCVAAALALLSTFAWAQDKAYTIERTYKAGDIGIYSFQMVANWAGAEVPASGVVERAVKEVKANGDVVFIYTDKGSKYVLNGEEADVPAEAPMTVTVDKRGKVLTIATQKGSLGMMPEGLLKLFAMISQCVLPDKAVKPADTWSAEFQNPSLKSGKFTLKSTFVGTDKVGDTTFLKLRETTSDLLLDIAEPGAGTLSTQTTFWVVPDTGRVSKLETAMKNVPLPGLGTVDVTMKATIKPPAPKTESKPETK